MKLATINNILRKLGFVFVVEYKTKNCSVVDEPATHMWLERTKTYDARKA